MNSSISTVADGDRRRVTVSTNRNRNRFGLVALLMMLVGAVGSMAQQASYNVLFVTNNSAAFSGTAPTNWFIETLDAQSLVASPMPVFDESSVSRALQISDIPVNTEVIVVANDGQGWYGPGVGGTTEAVLASWVGSGGKLIVLGQCLNSSLPAAGAPFVGAPAFTGNLAPLLPMAAAPAAAGSATGASSGHRIALAPVSVGGSYFGSSVNPTGAVNGGSGFGQYASPGYLLGAYMPTGPTYTVYVNTDVTGAPGVTYPTANYQSYAIDLVTNSMAWLINRQPLLAASSNSETVDEGSAIPQLTLTGTDWNYQNALTYEIVSADAGMVPAPTVGDLAGNTFDWTPDVSTTPGTYDVVFRVRDSGENPDLAVLSSTTQTLSITVNETNPVAVDDNANTDEDTPVTLSEATLIGNDTDPDAGGLDITLVNNPVNGAIVDNGDNTYTFTPAGDYNGAASFDYTVSDGNGGTDVGTVNVTVDAVNDEPVMSLTASHTSAEDAGHQAVAGFASSIAGGGSDESGQTFTYHITNVTNSDLFTTQPTIAPDGELHYEADADSNGSSTVTVYVQDNGGTPNGGDDASPTQTFDINVTAVNDPPVATNNSYTTAEDVPMVNVDISGLVSDIDGGPLTASTAIGASSGTVTWPGALVFTYTPNSNFNGSDNFTYEVNDGAGGTDQGLITITVTEVNDAPVLTAIGGQVATEGQTLSITLSSTDIEDDTRVYSMVAAPAMDPAPQLVGNLFTWTPDYTEAPGPYAVTFTVTDDGTTNGGSDPQQDFEIVSISVTNVTTANDDNYSTTEDIVTIAGNVLDGSGGGADEFSFPLTNMTVVSATTNGVLTGPNLTGDFNYVPNADWYGTDQFTYRLDDDGDVSQATVSIEVRPVNDEPSFTAGADQTVNEDEGPWSVANWATAISVGPPNESAQSPTFEVEVLSGASLFSSAPAVSPTGTLSYDANTNLNGTAQCRVRITDDGGLVDGGDNTSDWQAFDIVIRAVNDEPQLTIGSDQTINEDAVQQIVNNFATKDPGGGTDEDGQTVTYTVTNNNNPLFSEQPWLNNTTGVLTYTAAADAHGQATVTVYVTDDGGTAWGGDDQSGAQQFIITVNSINDEPSFVAGADVTRDEDVGAVSIPNWATAISAGPPNESGQGLTFEIVNVTNPGIFTAQPVITPSGTLSFTVAANDNGQSTVTYRLRDDGGLPGDDVTDDEQFTITINEVNDLPVASGTAISTNEEVLYSGDLTTLVTDVDFGFEGDNHTYAISVDAADGDLVIQTNGSFTYDPDPDFNGPDQFTYSVTDDGGVPVTAVVTITVNNINDAPEVVITATGSVDEDNQFTGALATFVTDADIPTPGDNLTWTLQTPALHGTVNLNSDGSFTYDPNANYAGADVFQYRVTDDAGAWDIGDVSLTVNPTNDAPLASDDSYITDEEDPIVDNLTSLVSDIDFTWVGDAHTYSVESDVSNGTLVIQTNGDFTYTPANDYFGPDQFQYRVTDNGSAFAIGTISITVDDVNDPPVITSTPPAAVLEENEYTYTVTATDIEGNTPFVFSLDDGPAGMNINSSTGYLDWTPTEGVNADVIVRVTDAGSPNEATTQSFTITVLPVNDAPYMDAIAGETVDEDAAQQVVTITGIDDMDVEQTQGLSIIVASDNPGLVPDPAVTYVSPNATGTLTYQPVGDMNGVANITVTLTDDNSTPGNPADDESFQRVFSITVNAVNDAPSMASISDLTIPEDNGLTTVSLSAISDNDAEAVQGISITATSDGAGIVPDPTVVYTSPNATGSLEFTPVADQSGTVEITVTITDDNATPGVPGDDESTVYTFNVEVTAVNDAPVVAGIPDQTIDEGDGFVTINLDDYVDDVDNADNQMTWTWGSSGALGVTIDANRVATITIPHADWFGSSDITFTAEDPGTLSDGDVATFTVNAVNDAPTFTSTPVLTVDEDALYTYNITVDDIDNDVGTEMTITAETLPTWLDFTDNGNGTATLTQTPTNDDVGDHAVVLRVSDPDMDYTDQPFTITVNNVNDAPVVAGIPDQTIDEDNAFVTFDLDDYVTDVDANDPLSSLVWSATGESDLTVAIDVDHVVTVTINNQHWYGAETITFTANDGEATGSDQAVFTVNPVNDAPVITNTAAAPLTGTEDIEYTFDFNHSDVEGDAVEWSLSLRPSGMTINPTTGEIAWTPQEGVLSGEVTVVVTETGTPETLSDSYNYTISVERVNDPPIISTTPAITGTEDVEYTYNPAASDVENDFPYAWALQDAPAGMTIDGGTGAITWTPQNGQEGAHVCTLTVTDNGLPAPVTTKQGWTITVAAVNDAPVANDDAYSTDEDIVLSEPASGVLANDVDIDNDIAELFVTVVDGPSDGALVLNPNGSFEYTPDANFNGTDQFTYEISDGDLISNTGTVTITVNAQNDQPVAVDDAYSTDEDTPLSIAAPGLIGNDTDVEGTTLTPALASGPDDGSVVINADGSFTYTPDADFNGPDQFTYTVDDGDLTSDPATVTITVNAINDAPVALDDAYSTNEDTELIIAAPGVLGNDVDVDGDALSAALVTPPSNGTATINSNGRLVYMPDANYNGADQLTYRANDGNLDSPEATVTITVNAVDDAPQTVADAYSTNEDNTLTVGAPGVLGNDTEIESQAMTANLVDDVADGSLTLNSDGSFEYIPDANFNGPVSFTYQAEDATNNLSVVTTVSIDVISVNDTPVITTTGGTTATEDEVYTYQPLATDVENHTLTWTLTQAPAGMTINSQFGTISWVAANAPNAIPYDETIILRVTDNGTPNEYVEETVVITVAPVNDAPVVDDIPGETVFEGTAFATIDLDNYVLDIDNPDADLTWTYSGDNELTVSIDAGTHVATITWPSADWNGSETITFTADDGEYTDSDDATFEAIPTNDGPIVADIPGQTLPEDNAFATINLDDYVSDIDNADSEISWSTSGETDLTVTIDASRVATITAPANWNGSETVTFTADDGGATDSDAATFTWTAVNDAPVAVADAYAVDEDNTLTVDAATGVLNNDTDVEDDPLTAALVSDVDDGTLTFNADGSFEYVPDADFEGADEFTYEVNDGSDNSVLAATVTITVNAQNDDPVVVDDAYTVSEDGAITVADGPTDLLANDSDVEGQTLTASITIGVTNGSITGFDGTTGEFTYTPDADFNGTDQFTYELSDGNGGTATAVAVITVDPLQDAPVATDDAYSTDEEVALVVDVLGGVLANDNDVDGESLEATVNTGVNSGTLVLNLDGSFTYTPDADFEGVDNFTYTVTDGIDSDVGSVDITVNNLNDAPVAMDDAYAVDEDNTLTVGTPGLVGNDVDVEGDNLTVSIVDDVDNGTLTNNGDGSFEYTPDAHWYGVDQFVYEIDDGNGGADQATASITVNPINDQPQFTSTPILTASEDVEYRYALTASDNDPTDVLTFSLGNRPSGMYIEVATQTIVWTPTEGILTSGTVEVYVSDNGSPQLQDLQTFEIIVTPVNDAPIIGSSPVLTATEEVGYTYAVTATDEEADYPLVWALVNEPAGMTITSTGPTTADVTWTPQNGDADPTVTIQATDQGSATGEQTFTIAVTQINDAPTVDAVAPVVIDEDAGATPIALTGISDGDQGAQVLTITAVSDNPGVVPDGVVTYTQGEATGTVTITPVANAHGIAQLTLTITDDGAGTSGGDDETIITIDVTVNSVNDAPTFTTTPGTEATEGVEYTYNPAVDDVEGDNITWSLATAPAGMTIDGNTGAITWTPPNNSPTPVDVTIEALDDGSPTPATGTQSYQIDVTPINTEPTLDAIADMTITEDDPEQTVSLSGITDGDAGTQNLTVTALSDNELLTGVVSVTYTPNDPTGSISFTPVADAFGSATITVTVMDDGGSGPMADDTFERSFTVTVDPVNDAPQITSDAPPATATEDVLYTFTPTVDDVENDGLTWSLVNGVIGDMAIVAGTGEFTWAPADGELTASVTVRVVDDGSPAEQDEQLWTIDVAPANDAPVADTPADLPLDEDAPEQVVTVTGIGDGDIGNGEQVLTITAVSNNVNRVPDPVVSYTQGETEATLTFTPVPDANGTAIITVTIEDDSSSNNTTDVTFDVVIAPVNDAPFMDAIADPAPVLEDAGQQTIVLSGIDDGDPDIMQGLTITAVSADNSLIPDPTVVFDQIAGTGTMVYTPVPDAWGITTVTVTMTDDAGTGNGGVDETIYTFDVEVTSVNDAPVVDQVADQNVNEGDPAQTVVLTGLDDGEPNTDQNLTITVSSSNPSVVSVPSGALAYTQGSGTTSFDYTIEPDASGTVTIDVTVTDDGGTPNGGVDQTVMSFAVNVTSTDNDQPVVQALGTVAAWAGTEVSFTVTATDPDGDALTMNVPGDLPATAVFVDNGDNTATVTWTPDPADAGLNDITFTASDASLTSDPVIVTVDVGVVNSNLIVDGLDASAKVYLYATSGWLGTYQQDGNGAISLIPGDYVMCVTQAGMRTEWAPVTIVDGTDETVTMNMRPTVPVMFTALTAVQDNLGSDINLGGFASAVMEDLDRDGDEDLVVVDVAGMLTVYDNDGGLQAGAAQDLGLAMGEDAQALRVIDIDGNDVLDYVVSLSTGEIVAFTSDNLTRSTVYTASPGLTGADVTDVNHDQEPDLFLSYSDGTVDLALSNGLGGWFAPVNVTDAAAAQLTVGANASAANMQLSNDEYIDMLVGNQAGEVVWLQRDMNGDYVEKGAVNAGGVAMAVSGDASLSTAPGAVGQLPKVVVTDAAGAVQVANGKLVGDINTDGTVGFADLLMFVDAWNSVEGDVAYNADANLMLTAVGAQAINFTDLLTLVDVWNLSL